MTNAERLKRLKMLKEMLDNHKKLFPVVKFDMGNWFEITSVTDLVLGFLGRGKTKSLCGTSACALGSAALYQPFNEMGLKLKEQGNWSSDLTPCYKGNEDMDAGQAFFGLNYEEAEHLFYPDAFDKQSENITPRDVAKRVQKLIDQYSKQPQKKTA